MEVISFEDYQRKYTEEFKACKGCTYRFKEKKGIISRQREEEEGFVFGCGLGQVGLLKEAAYLPEQCPARNIKANKGIYQFKPQGLEQKERDNCSICMVYKDQKPVCKTEGIRTLFCPCKACPDFTRTEYGCINYTDKCKERFKYELLDAKV